MCIFFIQQTGDSWKEKCNGLFETYNILRTIVISDNIETMSHLLEEELHSVYVLTTEDYYGEFEKFIESSRRVLLMSYEQYLDAFEYILYMLMDQHNLLILEGLEPDQNRYIIESIQGAEGTGFISKDNIYYIWPNNFLEV